MADFNIRSESVDVEQIMKQIRTRIREKRGVDYTEDQVRELAAVRLEKFLDPQNLRSDLLEQFRRSRPAIPSDPPPVEAPYEFNDETLFASHRGPLRFIRKLLRPFLKLFFNPNTLNQILHTQAQFNVDLMKREQRRRIEFDRSRSDWNALYYEVLHNLVLETTRNGIELKNLKMRMESLASRLDFSERRVRALEGVVQYRPEAVRPRPSGRGEQGEGRDRDRDRDRGRERPARADGDTNAPDVVEATPAAPLDSPIASAPSAPGASSESIGRRRRRRRRGRRGAGAPPGAVPGTADAADVANESGEPDAFDEGDEFEAGDSQAGNEEPGADDMQGSRNSEGSDNGTPSDPDQQ